MQKHGTTMGRYTVSLWSRGFPGFSAAALQVFSLVTVFISVALTASFMLRTPKFMSSFSGILTLAQTKPHGTAFCGRRDWLREEHMT